MNRVIPEPETELERLGFRDYEARIRYVDCLLDPNSQDYREWQRGWAKGYLARDKRGDKEPA